MNWKQALALGLCSVGAYAVKEPVAYLYNGVRLPKLPEWDKTAYPYAVILPDGGVAGGAETMYRLRIVDRPFVVDSGDLVYCIDPDSQEILYRAFSTDGEWEYEKSGVIGFEQTLRNAVWTNTDIMTLLGEVHLAASDPVPVYE